MKIINFFFYNTIKKKIPVNGYLHENFIEIMEKNQINFIKNLKFYLFFKGKLINPILSISYYNINNDSKIILIIKKFKKKNNLKENLNILNLNSNNNLFNEIEEERLRISDRIFSTWEMSKKQEIVFKTIINTKNEIEENIHETNLTNLSYEKSISKDPLPICFSNFFLNENLNNFEEDKNNIHSNEIKKNIYLSKSSV